VKYSSSFINAEFTHDPQAKTFNVLDKNNSEVLQTMSFVNSNHIETCIQSAKVAHETLQGMEPELRASLLRTCAQKLREQKNEFSCMISLEAGKPISYARVEVERAVKCLEIAANECRKLKNKEVSLIDGKKTLLRRFCLAPILGITPFNFPLNLMIHKVAPALAVGTSIVIKPSLYTPISSLMFAKLVAECGFPKGSLNIILCEDELAQSLVESNFFSMMSFTGSAKVGWMLKEKVGKKKVALELGGCAPVIVETVQDINFVAQEIAKGCFLYAGQICISTQRILVHEKIYFEFKKSLLKAIDEITSGPSTKEETINGPLISSESLARIHKTVINSKGRVLCGGEVLNEQSNIYAPTIIENPDSESALRNEEIFGPVASIESYSEFEEAIQRVNDSKFGLQIGVYTSSQEQMEFAFKHLEYAGVIINNIPGFRDDNMPYGGVKDSGFGREGIRYAMKEMTELKLMVI
jgi:glyceraldehyde-3-phosphate dehydrogenase (NADP+)